MQRPGVAEGVDVLVGIDAGGVHADKIGLVLELTGFYCAVAGVSAATLRTETFGI